MSAWSIYRKDGYEAGKAAGSWVLDGNSSEATAQKILEGYDEGDPEIMDMQPAPLSGEWAGDPTPDTLASEYGIVDAAELDAACDEYELGFSEGFWAEVLRSAQVYAS